MAQSYDWRKLQKDLDNCNLNLKKSNLQKQYILEKQREEYSVLYDDWRLLVHQVKKARRWVVILTVLNLVTLYYILL